MNNKISKPLFYCCKFRTEDEKIRVSCWHNFHSRNDSKKYEKLGVSESNGNVFQILACDNGRVIGTKIINSLIGAKTCFTYSLMKLQEMFSSRSQDIVSSNALKVDRDAQHHLCMFPIEPLTVKIHSLFFK